MADLLEIAVDVRYDENALELNLMLHDHTLLRISICDTGSYQYKSRHEQRSRLKLDSEEHQVRCLLLFRIYRKPSCDP